MVRKLLVVELFGSSFLAFFCSSLIVLGDPFLDFLVVGRVVELLSLCICLILREVLLSIDNSTSFSFVELTSKSPDNRD